MRSPEAVISDGLTDYECVRSPARRETRDEHAHYIVAALRKEGWLLLSRPTITVDAESLNGEERSFEHKRIRIEGILDGTKIGAQCLISEYEMVAARIDVVKARQAELIRKWLVEFGKVLGLAKEVGDGQQSTS
jgi:hypothetical protein